MSKNSKESLFDAPISDDLRKRVIDLMLKLQELKNEVEDIHYTQEEELFFEKMWNVWEFFETYSDKEAYEIFSHTKEYQFYKEYFHEKDFYFERAVDSTEALNIIAQNPDYDILNLLGHTFSKKVLEQAASEVLFLNQEKIKTLVMVGCGSMPETVISLVENTQIEKIIALDIDPEAVMMAGRVTRKLGMGKKVVIECVAGESFDYSSVDAVHIANFVTGKRAVLDQISKTAKNGCQIIARKARLLSSLAYESIYSVLHPQLILRKEETGAFYDFYVFEKFGFNADEK